MDERRLQLFLTVVEEMNFSRAAASAGLSQPGLTQQIRRLEADLGVELFDRSRRQVALTDAGRHLADEAAGLLDHHEQVRESTRAAGRGEVGEIRMAAVGTAIISLVPGLLTSLAARHPGIRLQLTEIPGGTTQIDAISTRRIDLGVVRHPAPAAPDVQVEPILDEPLVAVLPATHPLAARDTVATRDLRDQPFVLWERWTSSTLYDRAFSEGGEVGFRPRVVQRVNGLHLNLATVAAGHAVSLLPASVRALQRDGVVFRDLAPPRPVSTLAAAWHTGNRAAALVTVLQALRQVAHSIGSEPPAGGIVLSSPRSLRPT